MVQNLSQGLRPQHDGWTSCDKEVLASHCREGVRGGAEVHARYVPIEQALRQCVGLDFKEFALITVDKHGHDNFYASASLAPHDVFSEDFKHGFHGLSASAMPMDEDAERASRNHGGTHLGPTLHNPGSDDRRLMFANAARNQRQRVRHQQEKTNSDTPRRHSKAGLLTRLAPRMEKSFKTEGSVAGSRSLEDVPLRLVVAQMQQLRIHEDDRIEEFYAARFRDLQQNACRIVAKAWVKALAPRKQSKHPYKGGDQCRPDWWPAKYKEWLVPHREPDHLDKVARVGLLIHILKLIIEPKEDQLESVRKSDLTVSRFKTITLECLSEFFKEKQKNDDKRTFVMDIFKVALQQERYKAGGIDGDTRVPILNRVTNLDDEEKEDEVNVAEVKPHFDLAAPTCNEGRHTSRAFAPSPSMRAGMAGDYEHKGRPQASVRHPFQDQSFFGDAPSYHISHLGFPHPQPDMQSPSHMEASHRSVGSTGYSSNPNHFMSWPSTGNGSMNSGYYTHAPPNAMGSSNTYQIPPLPAPHPPPSLPSFEGLPHSNQVLNGSISSSHQMSSHVPQNLSMNPSFDGYIEDAGFGNNDIDLKPMHVDHPLHQRDPLPPIYRF